MVGAGIGVAAGGIIGGAVSGWTAEGVLVGMGIGFGGGAIIGAVIGGTIGGAKFGTFTSKASLNYHFGEHAHEFEGMFSTTKEYAKGAKYVIKNGTYVPEMNGYIRFFGAKGGANYAFVGLTHNGARVTTFGIRSVSSLIEKGITWLII